MKPKNSKTKKYMTALNKNPLISVSTKSKKEMKVIFSYLAEKQFEVEPTQIKLFNAENKVFVLDHKSKVEDLVANPQ
jgi:hypothetical protein